MEYKFYNLETETQIKMAKMTAAEKEAYLKGLEKRDPNIREKLFGNVNSNSENQINSEEEINLYTPTTQVSTETSSETENNLPNTKDELEALTFSMYGNAINWKDLMPEIDVTKYEFKKDSNGNITDIYPKDFDKSADTNGTNADRYSLRYDSQGNLVKSFKQDIDENGNVRGQEIKNYNAEGTVKNTAYYRYTYDENGNQTNQYRSVVSEKYGDDAQILQKIFGVELENVDMMTFNHIPAVGERNMWTTYKNRGEVTYNQDGTVSEITYNGDKYLLRYDDEGNLTKAIKQSFRGVPLGENIHGLILVISEQEITTFGSDGAKIKEVRTYDEQGVDNT
ncbi:hypothetical protein IJS77_03630, partial [bacterium]|nr:hypothetical protein [bacterium]